MQHDDDYLFQATYDERERTHSPPMFAYSAYPPPDDMLLQPSYGAAAQQPYRTMAATTSAEPYADSLFAGASAVPVTLPSMTHFSDAVKREAVYATAGGAGDDSFSPYLTTSAATCRGWKWERPRPTTRIRTLM